MAKRLKLLGYHVWFDRDLIGGQDWWDFILKEIRQCDVLLVALTPKWTDSSPCKLEYEYAEQLLRYILPVAFKRVDSDSYSLLKRHYVEFYELTDATISKLQQALDYAPQHISLPSPLPPAPEAPISPEIKNREVDFRRRAFGGHRSRIWSVAFSPNGEYVLTGGGDETARLWDVSTGKQLHQLDCFANTIRAIAFSPSGKHILMGTGEWNIAYLWDSDKRRVVQQFRGHSEAITDVAFSPEGQQVVTGSYDGTVRLWDIFTGKELHQFIVGPKKHYEMHAAHESSG